MAEALAASGADAPAPRASADARDRLLALCDGVIAIAITLLVLELVPHVAEEVTGGALVDALLERWPELLAYFLSFLVIGRLWDTHRRFFEHIPVADIRAVWITLLFLRWVTLIPATAALLGSHGQEPTALILYAANLLLATATLWGLWRYVSSAGYLRREGLPPRTEPSVDRYFAVSLVGYALIVPAAFLSPTLALLLIFLTTVLARTLAGRLLAPGAAAA